MNKFMAKCSLCGKTVVVDPITINARYGIKCEACKKENCLSAGRLKRQERLNTFKNTQFYFIT